MDHGNGACCAPSARRRSSRETHAVAVGGAANGSRDGMVRLGGSFLMGTSDRDQVPGDGEGPVREVHVSDFYVDARAVTNADFRRFVDATRATSPRPRPSAGRSSSTTSLSADDRP